MAKVGVTTNKPIYAFVGVITNKSICVLNQQRQKKRLLVKRPTMAKEACFAFVGVTTNKPICGLNQ